MEGARVRIKCPNCGLVQWKSAACHRCGTPFEAPPADAAPTPAAQVPAEPGQQQTWAQPPQAEPAQQTGTAQSWAPPAEPAAPSIEVRPPAVASPQAHPEPQAGMADIYAPPTAEVGAAAFPGAAVGRFGAITEDMVVTLEGSSRWMAHNSRFGYLMAVVYILVALAGLGAGSMVSGDGEGSGAVLFGMLLGYGLMAAIVFMIAHHLRGAARAAKQIREASNPGMVMADMLQHQAYVWKVTGIISLISLVLLFVSMLLILGGVITGLAN
ncbi:MAG: hypothetical protein AAFX50_00240 [Acidobacteriota bacterium]